jgi:hypothetical protein
MILTHLVLLKFFAGAGQAAEVEEGQLSGGTANWYWLDKKRRDAFLKAKKTRQEAEEAALARASEKVRESLRETLAPEVLAPAERLERGLTDTQAERMSAGLKRSLQIREDDELLLLAAVLAMP